MTPDTIALLEEAFLWGYTDIQASFHANIGSSTLERYCEKNPEYRVRKETLKQSTEMLSKKTLHASISEGNSADAKWHLERKDPDYSPKSTNTHMGPDGGPIEITARCLLLPDDGSVYEHDEETEDP